MNFNLLLGLVAIVIIAGLGYMAILMVERIEKLKAEVERWKKKATESDNRLYKYAKTNAKEYRKPVMPEDAGRRN